MMSKLWRFAVVGGVGFAVDTSLFALFFYGIGWPILGARVVSFFFAATVTWFGNRIFTFTHQQTTGKFSQWLKFVGCATLSAVPNVGVFKLTTYYCGSDGVLAMLALALGVLAGMVSNFAFCHCWVFGQQSLPRTESQ